MELPDDMRRLAPGPGRKVCHQVKREAAWGGGGGTEVALWHLAVMQACY